MQPRLLIPCQARSNLYGFIPKVHRRPKLFSAAGPPVDPGYNPGYSQGPEARGPNPENITNRPGLWELRKGGVEPPRLCGNRILSPALLPVPPLPNLEIQ